MKTGIIELTFDASITDEKVQKLISNFYQANCEKISGMLFTQFKTEADFKDVRSAIRLVMKDLPVEDDVNVLNTDYVEDVA